MEQAHLKDCVCHALSVLLARPQATGSHSNVDKDILTNAKGIASQQTAYIRLIGNPDENILYSVIGVTGTQKRSLLTLTTWIGIL